MNIQLKRNVRTHSSESYIVFLDSENVGSLDLHFCNCVYGTLIFTHFFTEGEKNEIFTKIEYEVVESIVPREDFIFSVYEAKDIGMYSDRVTDEDRAYEPAKVRDFESISKLVKSALGKKQNIQGKLTEYIAVDFFETLGYEAKRADSRHDHMKIDVIAETDEEIILVQVKSGSIGIKQIEDAVKSVSEYPALKEKVAAFIANEYPVKSEKLRKDLFKKYGISVQFYHGYQVLKNLPEYKNSL